MYVNNLSFDPHDPLFTIAGLYGVRWSIQLFTVHNLYTISPDGAHIEQIENGVRLTCDELSWAGQQQRSSGRIQVEVCSENGVYTWFVNAQHAEKIKAVKIALHGLPEPALGRGWWQSTSEDTIVVHVSDTLPLRWRYPWPEWHTAWACAGDESSAVCVSIRDTQVRAKRLYVYRAPYASGDIVELICEEDAANWSTEFSSPQIRLRLCQSQSEIDRDFSDHLEFVEQAYQLPRWETRPDTPSWMRDIRLVLNLHGQHWTGYVFNTFDKMAEILRFVTSHIPGENVLVYIPGWEGRYYYAYPNYQPGDALGGSAGFERLIAQAKALGTRVMPMFGIHGANLNQYPEWQQAVLRTRNDAYVRLINLPDWDNDRAGEEDQIFLNVGEPTFRQHLFEQIDTTVRRFAVDGVFLDTSACWINDPRYNLYAGYEALVNALHQKHSDLLIAGEGWFDAMLRLFAVNQSWLGTTRKYRYPQMLTNYARALGHLKDGTPGNSSGVHEGGYYPQSLQSTTFGHIPSLGFVSDTMALHKDAVIAACRAAVADFT